jgi:hypothetical protein
VSLPAPQSKPVAAASRLVAQVAPLVAFGPGLRILAAGPVPRLTVLSFLARSEYLNEYLPGDGRLRPVAALFRYGSASAPDGPWSRRFLRPLTPLVFAASRVSTLLDSRGKPGTGVCRAGGQLLQVGWDATVDEGPDAPQSSRPMWSGRSSAQRPWDSHSSDRRVASSRVGDRDARRQEPGTRRIPRAGHGRGSPRQRRAARRR